MNPATSYVRGATTPPLLDQTIGQALNTAAERFGACDALVSVHQGVRWTFAELKARAASWPWGLSRAIGSASGRPTRPNGP